MASSARTDCYADTFHRVAGNAFTSCYDFHGLFRLSVHSDGLKALRHFRSEYGAFQARMVDAPDLEVFVGKFTMPPAERPDSDNDDLRESWVHIWERHKVAHWRCAVNDIAGRTTQLLFHGGIFSLDFLQHYIEQIMRFKISQRGLVLMHAACTARAGRSILFPGLGHAGKTALALQRTLAGDRFQADDYTFLSSTGVTYSYPRRLHISKHMEAVCPGAMAPLSLKHKLSINAKYFIYYLSLKYGDLSESLQLRQMIPEAEVADRERLAAVVLLIGADASGLLGPLPLGKGDLIDRVMDINRREGSRFAEILGGRHNSDYVNLEDWWEREREVLRQALVDVPGYQIVVPRRPKDPEAMMDRLVHAVDKVLE